MEELERPVLIPEQQQTVYLVRLWSNFHGVNRELFTTVEKAKAWCDSRRFYDGEWVEDGADWLRGNWTITPMVVRE